MEIYGDYHKSCSAYICVYNNIIKNSLSKALKHIRAPAPSPSPFSSQKLRRSQKKKQTWLTYVSGHGDSVRGVAWHRFIKPPTICSIWHDCFSRDLYGPARGLPEQSRERQVEIITIGLNSWLICKALESLFGFTYSMLLLSRWYSMKFACEKLLKFSLLLFSYISF